MQNGHPAQVVSAQGPSHRSVASQATPVGVPSQLGQTARRARF